MTCEIAVLNKSAVALAADSAVTVGGQNPKIWHSANKIFTLSKYQPVGVMIYGNAELMGLPWETIIKAYRKDLGTRSLPRLLDYAIHLVDYINSRQDWFPLERQESVYTEIACSFFKQVLDDIRNEMKTIFGNERKTPITILDVKNATKKVATNRAKAITDMPARGLFRKNHQTLRGPIKKTVLEKYFRDIFQNWPIFQADKTLLISLVFDLLGKKYMGGRSTSGIVVAGFGKNDVCPALISIECDAVVGKKLHYTIKNGNGKNVGLGARIVPFAQSDMVATFMEGVHPEFKTTILSFIEKLLNNFVIVACDEFGGLNNAEKEKIKGKLLEGTRIALEDLYKGVDRYSEEKQWGPVVKIVSSLPKEELAIIAETLVNLTSFRRRVTQDAETVGGPIDVAVISRGDGFIWIKRKHYFNPELNGQFWLNYFREDPQDEDPKNQTR